MLRTKVKCMLASIEQQHVVDVARPEQWEAIGAHRLGDRGTRMGEVDRVVARQSHGAAARDNLSRCR